MRPSAVVYLSQLHERIIVVPRMSPTTGNDVGAGVYMETQPIATLDWTASSESLGQMIWEALLMFRVGPLPERKPEWGAYRVSGLKSKRTFQEEFVHVSIDAYPVVLSVQATVPAKVADGLYVGRSISNACEFDALGDLVRQAHRCALHILEAEFGYVRLRDVTVCLRPP